MPDRAPHGPRWDSFVFTTAQIEVRREGGAVVVAPRRHGIRRAALLTLAPGFALSVLIGVGVSLLPPQPPIRSNVPLAWVFGGFMLTVFFVVFALRAVLHDRDPRPYLSIDPTAGLVRLPRAGVEFARSPETRLECRADWLAMSSDRTRVVRLLIVDPPAGVNALVCYRGTIRGGLALHARLEHLTGMGIPLRVVSGGDPVEFEGTVVG